jgi:hypothetical protein
MTTMQLQITATATTDSNDARFVYCYPRTVDPWAITHLPLATLAHYFLVVLLLHAALFVVAAA